MHLGWEIEWADSGSSMLSSSVQPPHNSMQTPYVQCCDAPWWWWCISRQKPYCNPSPPAVCPRSSNLQLVQRDELPTTTNDVVCAMIHYSVSMCCVRMGGPLSFSIPSAAQLDMISGESGIFVEYWLFVEKSSQSCQELTLPHGTFTNK